MKVQWCNVCKAPRTVLVPKNRIIKGLIIIIISVEVYWP